MDILPTLLQPLDPSKPSLFELLSEAQLSSLLPPSLRYILALITHRYPRYLIRILNNFDEVYALLSIVVEKYYLETFGGGFVENFYGLKRERVLGLKGGEVRRAGLLVPSEVRDRLQLRNRRTDIWKNLAIMVGIPYLKRKLDESYDIHIAPSASLMSAAGLGGGVGGPRYLDRDALPPDATIKQKVMYWYKWFLRHVYPSLNAAYYFSILAFSLGYLFDGTKYSDPFLWMTGTRIRRMGEADYRAIDAAAAAASSTSSTKRPGQGLAGFFHPTILWPKILSSLRLFLPTSVFALKFLEWWHASDFSRQLTRKAAEGLELPPPIVSGVPPTTASQGLIQQRRKQQQQQTQNQKPTSDTKPQPNQGIRRDPPISSTTFLPIFTVSPPTSTDLCPICLHPIETPAACQTGYIFDYKCIFQWVEGTHDRQEAWMKGDRNNEWEDDDDDLDNHNNNEDGDLDPESEISNDNKMRSNHESDNAEEEEKRKRQSIERQTQRSREGRWESGKGRCAVTGRRVLGDTGGIRLVRV